MSSLKNHMKKETKKQDKPFYSKDEIKYLHALIDELNEVGGYVFIGVKDAGGIRGSAGVSKMSKGKALASIIRGMELSPGEVMVCAMLADGSATDQLED